MSERAHMLRGTNGKDENTHPNWIRLSSNWYLYNHDMKIWNNDGRTYRMLVAKAHVSCLPQSKTAMTQNYQSLITVQWHCLMSELCSTTEVIYWASSRDRAGVPKYHTYVGEH
jgi:hypothetical protein